MARQALASDDIQPDAGDARRSAREILVDDRAADADRFEDLCAAIALHRRDSHLRGDLDDPLVGRLDVILLRLIERDVLGKHPFARHVRKRLESEIGIDRAGAIADQQAEMMHFARLAGLDDQAALRARSLADEMVMHRGSGEQAGNRGVVRIDSAIGKNQNRCAVLDRQRRRVA